MNPIRELPCVPRVSHLFQVSLDEFPEDVVADLPAQPWLRSVRPVSRCSHGLGRGATRRSRNSGEFLRDPLTFAGAGLRYHANKVGASTVVAYCVPILSHSMPVSTSVQWRAMHVILPEIALILNHGSLHPRLRSASWDAIPQTYSCGKTAWVLSGVVCNFSIGFLRGCLHPYAGSKKVGNKKNVGP